MEYLSLFKNLSLSVTAIFTSGLSVESKGSVFDPKVLKEQG